MADGQQVENVFENNIRNLETSVPYFQAVEYGNLNHVDSQITSSKYICHSPKTAQLFQ